LATCQKFTLKQKSLNSSASKRPTWSGQVHFEDEIDVHIKKSTTLDDDIKWDQHVQLNLANFIAAERSSSRNEGPHNASINLSWAIHKLKPLASPGPDRIISPILKFASKTALEAIHLTIQKCWRQVIIPTLWKEEARIFIFIPKADKPDYNAPKAY
jgi:hypothetical protein